jgi:hypothetical protein
MKIKNGYIADDEFMNALSYLLKRELTAKQCLEMNQAQDELIAHQRVIVRSKYQIMEKHAKKDEEGKMVTQENGDVVFPSEEARQECVKEILEIMNEEYDVDLSSKIVIYEDEPLRPSYYNLIKDLVEIKERPKN